MGGWLQSLTSYSQPEMLASISRKKGLVLFLNHRKNCCSLEVTLSRQTYQISRWHSGIVLVFFWKSAYARQELSHDAQCDHIAERHGTKRTLKQTILNSRIPFFMALLDSFLSNNEVGQVEVSGSPCWRREKRFPVSTWASLASRK